MRKKVAIALMVVVLIGLIAGPAFAALIWHQSNTTVVKADKAGSQFDVYGYNSAASFDGSAVWYKDCTPLLPRVMVKQKSNGVVQVVCISAYPTPAPTQSP